MTEQLFNYKVLTDSVTNQEFYCIDKSELRTLLVNNTSTESYNYGYRNGCAMGIILSIVAIYLYRTAVRMLSNKVKSARKEKEMLTEDKNNND